MAKVVDQKNSPSEDFFKELQEHKTLLRTSNAHILSILRAFIHFMKYLLTKCLNQTSGNQFGAATSMSNYSHINPIGGLNPYNTNN